MKYYTIIITLFTSFFIRGQVLRNNYKTYVNFDSTLMVYQNPSPVDVDVIINLDSSKIQLGRNAEYHADFIINKRILKKDTVLYKCQNLVGLRNCLWKLYRDGENETLEVIYSNKDKFKYIKK